MFDFIVDALRAAVIIVLGAIVLKEILIVGFFLTRKSLN